MKSVSKDAVRGYIHIHCSGRVCTRYSHAKMQPHCDHRNSAMVPFLCQHHEEEGGHLFEGDLLVGDYSTAKPRVLELEWMQHLHCWATNQCSRCLSTLYEQAVILGAVTMESVLRSERTNPFILFSRWFCKGEGHIQLLLSFLLAWNNKSTGKQLYGTVCGSIQLRSDIMNLLGMVTSSRSLWGNVDASLTKSGKTRSKQLCACDAYRAANRLRMAARRALEWTRIFKGSAYF